MKPPPVVLQRLCAANAARGRRLAAAAVVAAAVLLAIAAATAQSAYLSIRITSPENEATVFDNEGRLDVAVEVLPPLDVAAGDRVLLTLDGTAASAALGHLSLVDVPRGAHIIEAAVVDRADRVLLRSTPVVVHVWRASRLFPGRVGTDTAPAPGTP